METYFRPINERCQDCECYHAADAHIKKIEKTKMSTTKSIKLDNKIAKIEFLAELAVQYPQKAGEIQEIAKLIFNDLFIGNGYMNTVKYGKVERPNSEEIRTAKTSGKLEAVKMYKERTSRGLMESKKIIESVCPVFYDGMGGLRDNQFYDDVRKEIGLSETA